VCVCVNVFVASCVAVVAAFVALVASYEEHAKVVVVDDEFVVAVVGAVAVVDIVGVGVVAVRAASAAEVDQTVGVAAVVDRQYACQPYLLQFHLLLRRGFAYVLVCVCVCAARAWATR